MSKNKSGREVLITGVGPVTAIGTGPEKLWDSLVAGKTNITRRTLPVDMGRTVELPIASMPPSSDVPGLERHVEFLAGQDCACYRDLGYALLAAELAFADAGLEYDAQANDIGMIQAFEAPGVEHTVSQLFAMMSSPMPTDGPPPVYDLLAPCFYNMQPFLYVHLMSKALGLHGFSTNVHNACSSGAFAMEVAAQRISSGQAEVMLVVGGESFDTAVRLEWFRTLDLYALNGDFTPFSRGSSGFFVGEGGGAIVLESSDHADRRGAGSYATYLGGSFAQQSWKQTIPDVRAGRLGGVISAALAISGVTSGEIDLVVPHGAGTQLSDGYEAASLAQALNGKAANAVATVFKPFVGHMLAASGIIETICALLCVKNGLVPAPSETSRTESTLGIPLVTTATQRQLKTVLKLSTGFTGHDTAALFRKV